MDNQWEGHASTNIPHYRTYADFPSPVGQNIGDAEAVTDDSNFALNGLHIALDLGASAEFWVKV